MVVECGIVFQLVLDIGEYDEEQKEGKCKRKDIDDVESKISFEIPKEKDDEQLKHIGCQNSLNCFSIGLSYSDP